MAFSDFDLRSAVDTFGLQEERDTDLFGAVTPLEPSEHLRAWLEEFAPVALGVNSEQARREYIISPILTEAKRRTGGPVQVLPGVAFEADRARGLTGFCDYIITRSGEYYYLRGPLMTVIEAEREVLIGGLGQCTATMVGMRVFNEKDGTPMPAIYGCVTSGSIWRFMRLDGSRLCIDRREHYLRETGTVLGILVLIIHSPVTPS